MFDLYALKSFEERKTPMVPLD